MKYYRIEMVKYEFVVSDLSKHTQNLTSCVAEKPYVPEKNDRYFDFKHLKICTHLNISYIFFISYVPWLLPDTSNPSH
jgi:hypothetical protein